MANFLGLWQALVGAVAGPTQLAALETFLATLVVLVEQVHMAMVALGATQIRIDLEAELLHLVATGLALALEVVVVVQSTSRPPRQQLVEAVRERLDKLLFTTKKKDKKWLTTQLLKMML
jgi:hypothetical protein